MSLLELTKDAIHQFDTYKEPNLTEWLNAINEILTVLYETTLEGRKIDDILLNEGQ